VSGPAVLTLRARTELRDALRLIGADNPAAAHALNDAVHEASMRIGSNPAIGARRPALAGERYRFWPIRRFHYLLVYTDRTAPPRIVRLVHMARDLPRVLADLPI
jgi:toxin ParE1/3/4